MRRIHVVSVVVALFLMISAWSCNRESAVGSKVTPEATAGSETNVKEFEDFNPNNFDRSTNIDNQWLPLKPGIRFVYEGTTTEVGETIPHRLEFTVTDLTKTIAGVRTVIAWIVDYKNDQLVEKEIAFYAQDKDGNVWYLGEHPEEYEDGQFVEAPTWIHGFKGARAGIKMPSEPHLGSPSFSQGWGPAVDFRDRGLVSHMGLQVCVPVECYESVLEIEEFTLVEPDAFQVKYYAPGVGNVRVGWRGADAQREDIALVELVQLKPQALAEIRALALKLEKHAYEISTDVYAQTPPSE